MKKMRVLAFIAMSISTYAFMSFTTFDKIRASASNTIKVSWAKETYNFGEIPQGKPVYVDFKFTNEGDEPIIVAEVNTSCGCTASDYSKEPIAPGKSSTIKVSYNAAAIGTFTKSITVNFQDPSIKKVLTIKGIVK